MVKRALHSIILLLLAFAVFAQGENITDLKSQLSDDPASEKRIELLTQLGKSYRSINKDSALYYLRLAVTEAENSGDHLASVRAKYFHSTVYGYAREYDVRDSLVQSGIRYSRVHDVPIGEGMFLVAIATRLEQEGRLMDAIDTLKKSLQLFREAHHDHHASVSVTNLSAIFSKAGLQDSALIYAQKAIDYKVDAGREKEALSDYGNMGILYLEIGELDLALEYHQKALELIDTSVQFKDAAWVYSNFGQVYKKRGTLDSATFYARKSLVWAQKSKRQFQIFNSAQLLGSIYEKLGDLELAKSTYQLGLDAAQKLKNVIHQTTMKCHLASLHIEENSPKDALILLRRAYPTALKNHNMPNISWSTELLSEAYAQNGQYDSAFHFAQIHKTYYDSIRGTEQSKHLMALERQFKTARQLRQLTQQELTIANQEGRMRTYLIGGLLLLLALIGIVPYFRYRQKLNDQRAQLVLELEKDRNRQWEELDRMKSNFFANISHEIRTPLTLIMSPIMNAREKYSTRNTPSEIPIKTRHIDLIQRNTQRLQHLVDQILDLSKIDGGYLQLHVTRGDVIKYLKMLAYSFESLAERNDILYQIKFDEGIEDAYFDEDKVEKIAINILSNAFKYTPQQGKISVAIRKDDDHVSFSVSDNGPGMSKEKLDMVFDRYFQLSNSQGAGIGLALVQELVDLYGGSVDVKSAEGKGSIFTILLPYKLDYFENLDNVKWINSQSDHSLAKHKFPPPQADVEGMSENSPVVSNAPMLLVVEDNDELRDFIAETMAVHFRVIKAQNGAEGLEKAISEIPDVIVSDVMMPKMDGMELCREIKSEEKTSHIPVILLTARAGKETKIEGFEIGADHYLTKPFSGQELKAITNNIVQQRRLLKSKYSSTEEPEETGDHLSVIDRDFVSKVIGIIDEHLDNDEFSVQDLAGAVHFSRSQLHRKLKAILDVTPSELIRDTRLAKALEMIKRGEGTISEIAFRVGYSNLSYFTKSFKEKFGKVPSEI